MNRKRTIPAAVALAALTASSLTAFADGNSFHGRPAALAFTVSAAPAEIPSTAVAEWIGAVSAVVAATPVVYQATAAVVEATAAAVEALSSSSSSSGGVAADPNSAASDEFDR